jgi:hypothetical protein
MRRSDSNRQIEARRRVGCPSRIRTSANGSKVRCPTTRRRGSERADPILWVREEKWSGRRDSNSRPSPWQGDALPTELLPLDPRRGTGAESQIRTGDTAIFSRVLYQLSYLGAGTLGPRRGCHGRAAEYHARARTIKASPSAGRPPHGADQRAAPRRSCASSAGSSTASSACTSICPLRLRSRLIRSSTGGCVENRRDARSSVFLMGFSK